MHMSFVLLKKKRTLICKMCTAYCMYTMNNYKNQYQLKSNKTIYTFLNYNRYTIKTFYKVTNLKLNIIKKT